MRFVILALAEMKPSAKAEATSFFCQLYFSYISTHLWLFIT
jgi:hypothetical protein